MVQIPSVSQRFLFKGQLAHLLLLAVLILAALWLVDFQTLSKRQLFGIGAPIWFTIALGVPILHQVYVWFAWRFRLCFGTLTDRLGSNAFVIYEILFLVLFLARPVSLVLLAIADHDSFRMPMPVRILICAILGVPAIYTFYLVARYFGMKRAAGIDHFDESYRKKPLVKKGIFRFASNSMYWFGFLTLWIIAIAAASWSALVVAGFSHAYIWVHYFCTERPDMQVIYGLRSE